jgi:hypothetical protein
VAAAARAEAPGSGEESEEEEEAELHFLGQFKAEIVGIQYYQVGGKGEMGPL